MDRPVRASDFPERSIHQSDERSRLINTKIPNVNASATEGPRPTGPPHKALLYIAVLLLLVAVQSGAGILQAIPLNQVFEDIICRNFHANVAPANQGPANQISCGDDKAVQAELTLLKGWDGTISLVPGLLTAVPYGFAADRYGHKMVLYLCILGLSLGTCFTIAICWWSNVFPIRLIWLSSLFTLIGGGPPVFSAIIFSMLTNLSSDIYRSTVFFCLGIVTMISQLLMSSVAAWLMQFELWLPIWIGSSASCCCLFIPLFLPETQQELESQSPVDTGSDNAPFNDHLDAASKTKTIWSQLQDSVLKSKTAIAFFIQGNKHILMLLLTFLVTTLGKHSHDILLQFARKRYGWSWSQAGYLITLKSLVDLLLLVVILPSTSYIMTKVLSTSARFKDFWMARASCAFLALGVLTTGLSSKESIMIIGLVLYCMGSAYNLILRSLLASLIQPNHRASLFNFIGMLENLGALVAGPLLVVSFQVGLRLEGVWIGLPFVAAGVLFISALIVLCSVRLP
ncbi:hypothetical protein EsH8_X_000401 [Colletotrichum jinshuiense]